MEHIRGHGIVCYINQYYPWLLEQVIKNLSGSRDVYLSDRTLVVCRKQLQITTLPPIEALECLVFSPSPVGCHYIMRSIQDCFYFPICKSIYLLCFLARLIHSILTTTIRTTKREQSMTLWDYVTIFININSKVF